MDSLADLDPELYAKGVQLIRLLLEGALKALQGEELDLRAVVASVGVGVKELSTLLTTLFD